MRPGWSPARSPTASFPRPFSGARPACPPGAGRSGEMHVAAGSCLAPTSTPFPPLNGFIRGTGTGQASWLYFRDGASWSRGLYRPCDMRLPQSTAGETASEQLPPRAPTPDASTCRRFSEGVSPVIKNCERTVTVVLGQRGPSPVPPWPSACPHPPCLTSSGSYARVPAGAAAVLRVGTCRPHQTARRCRRVPLAPFFSF